MVERGRKEGRKEGKREEKMDDVRRRYYEGRKTEIKHNVGWCLWHIKPCGSFNAKSNFDTHSLSLSHTHAHTHILGLRELFVDNFVFKRIARSYLFAHSFMVSSIVIKYLQFYLT